jgi:hypothetical protein
LFLLIAIAGCASSPSNDVVGPFTGPIHRFAIDAITVPRDSAEADRYAADLDGDGKPENQLGLVTAVLASTNDLSIHASDMIASGALASSIEIQADDLIDDDSVGVRYLGAEGEIATVAGGRLVAGAFRSNRTFETRAPGRALVRLPVYTNADPLIIDLEGMELELEPDGSGGFDAIVRGGIRQERAREVAYTGLVQMFETEPERHLVFERGVDTDRDGVMSRQEVDDSVIALLVTADLHLFDGERYAPRAADAKDSLSLGFAIHLSPCPSGTCATSVPANGCRDRVRDGDETDIDCGGSCQPCADVLACTVPGDCQTRGCDAGRCRAATCSDGIRDGYESDIDCGGACGVCQVGQACAADADCQSEACDQGVAAAGTCLGP